jgi:homogentisate phytyltransferase/homogentisate geranylgeranyltransferase
MLVGTAYSLQPLHLKARPIWAALSIAFVRGVVANIGVFLHFHQKLQPASDIPWLLVAGLAIFFFGFGLVIGLYKDIPDLSGDRQFGIRTFTVRLGPERVFKGGRLILTGFYLIPIIASLALMPGLDGFVLLFSHLFIVVIFWLVSRSVDPSEPVAITRFYMFLWFLFYVEYLLLSFNTIARSGASILS